MIRVPFVFPQNIDEYVMLEMQGQLENTAENQDLDSAPLGQLLQLDEKQFKLIIGMHDILGTLNKLKDPIVVSKKQMVMDPVTQIESLQITVQGVCYNKIVFITRPTPILERFNKQMIKVDKTDKFPFRKK